MKGKIIFKFFNSKYLTHRSLCCIESKSLLACRAERGLLLPDLDSNQDKQSQSLSYYRYTIRQIRIKK